MPAKSQAQQRFFGMLDAAKRGEIPESEMSEDMRKAYKGMTLQQIRDFAKTKRKGLPERKTKDENTKHASEISPFNLTRDFILSLVNNNFDHNPKYASILGKNLSNTMLRNDNALKLKEIIKLAEESNGNSVSTQSSKGEDGSALTQFDANTKNQSFKRYHSMKIKPSVNSFKIENVKKPILNLKQFLNTRYISSINK